MAELIINVADTGTTKDIEGAEEKVYNITVTGSKALSKTFTRPELLAKNRQRQSCNNISYICLHLIHR